MMSSAAVPTIGQAVETVLAVVLEPLHAARRGDISRDRRVRRRREGERERVEQVDDRIVGVGAAQRSFIGADHADIRSGAGV